MSVDQTIARHYTHGSLEQAILAALKAAGKDTDHLTHVDLSTVDEFHIGGRQATTALFTQLDLPHGARVLDVGSGIGGPARYGASEHGWHVQGVDLTEEFVRVAEALSRRVGTADRVSFRQASAVALPFDDGSFDGAYMLHVGMNIPDKKSVFAEVHRVLRPGGIFAVFDLMRENDAAFDYPVPWSSAPETNFIDTPGNYRTLLGDVGFAIETERNRRDFALEFFRQTRERMAEAQAKGRPAPSPPVVMGPTAPQKLANMRALVERGTIAPVELIARRA
ncbi:MAG: class I SAM-dependent methyltransferase [Reyranellaceae bacterium]